MATAAPLAGHLVGQGGCEPGRTGPRRPTNDDRRRGTGERALPCVTQGLQLGIATDQRGVVTKLGRDVDAAPGELQARILGEDPSVQIAQTVARVDAELVGEDFAYPVVGLERLGLLTTAVVGEHQQLPQPLAQRVIADVPLELGHDRALTAER